MKDLMKVLGGLAALVAIVKLLESKHVCVCAGPFCVCGSR
jgi:hypothetical protein